MASPYRFASAAAFPRCFNFSAKHWLKSDRKRCVSDDIATQGAQPLAMNPFDVLVREVRIPCQFTRHLAETLDRIRYATSCFKTFTQDLIKGVPGLQTNNVSPTTNVIATYSHQRRIPGHLSRRLESISLPPTFSDAPWV